jgi:large subunit ribosomal protein L10
MTREEKAAIIEDLKVKFSENAHFYITDAGGLTVAQINNFRRMCFEKGLEYRVIKNTLIKKALETFDTDFSSLDAKALKGFSGVLFSKESGKLPASLILDYRKKAGSKETRPVFKGASIEGAIFLGEENLVTLSKLKSKDELIGDIIGLLQSPAKNVVSALQSAPQTIGGLIKTLQER